MRFPNSMVIFILGMICFSPAYGEQAKMPNEITLKLNSSVVLDRSPTIAVSLNSKIGFYKGFANLVISSQGKDVVEPIRLFSGNGKAGQHYQTELVLPPLADGKYRIHGTYIIYPSKKHKQPIRVGSNLYLDIDDNNILSSNISFADIKRQQLQQLLAARQRQGLSNELAILKKQAPDLYQKLQQANQVQAIQTHGVNTIKAQSTPLVASKAQSTPLVATIELSAGQVENPDPRKQSKRKRVAMDIENAVLESSANDF